MATVDLWLTAGQSNMTGRGDGTLAPATDPELAWEWAAGSLVQLVDPGGGGPYESQTGSLLPAFVNTFTGYSQRPSVVVRGAVGGTALLEANAASMGGWWDSATNGRFDYAVGRAGQAVSTIEGDGHTIGRVNVLWHQGERDAQGGADLGTYQSATEALVDRFRADLGVPDLNVYLWRVGTTVDPAPGWQTVRDAQDAATAAQDGLVMVYTRCVDFFNLGWMKADDLHYTQDGLNDMGVVGGKAVAADLGYPVDSATVGVPSSLVAARLLRL